eukprot:7290356-Pyramimonas_sp.AAC.1
MPGWPGTGHHLPFLLSLPRTPSSSDTSDSAGAPAGASPIPNPIRPVTHSHVIGSHHGDIPSPPLRLVASSEGRKRERQTSEARRTPSKVSRAA